MEGLEPDAFSMMDLERWLANGLVSTRREDRAYLSMKAIRGHIRPAAQDALTTSAPSRMPRFFVFHCRALGLVCVSAEACVVVVEEDAIGVGDRRGVCAVAAVASGAMSVYLETAGYAELAEQMDIWLEWLF